MTRCRMWLVLTALKLVLQCCVFKICKCVFINRHHAAVLNEDEGQILDRVFLFASQYFLLRFCFLSQKILPSNFMNCILLVRFTSCFCGRLSVHSRLSPAEPTLKVQLCL